MKPTWWKDGDKWIKCPGCKQDVVKDKRGVFWPAPGNAQTQEDDIICGECGSRIITD